MAVKKKTEEALPTIQQQNLPAVPQQQHEWGDLSGKGFEGTTSDDYVMPMLKLLQANSPELTTNEALRPGMMINTVTKQSFGKGGIIFVPVARQHLFVEWRERENGGGLIARHDPSSRVVIEAKARSTKFGDYQTEDGNEIIETFYLMGYTLSDAKDTSPDSVLVIPFTGSKIKRYKAMMQTLNMVKGSPPLFAHRLLITTEVEKNSLGTFYNLKIAPALGTTIESMIPRFIDKERTTQNPLVQYGMDLNKQILAGQRTMSDESAAHDAPGGGGRGHTDEVDTNNVPF
jgi:hypothetical protein